MCVSVCAPSIVALVCACLRTPSPQTPFPARWGRAVILTAAQTKLNLKLRQKTIQNSYLHTKGLRGGQTPLQQSLAASMYSPSMTHLGIRWLRPHAVCCFPTVADACVDYIEKKINVGHASTMVDHGRPMIDHGHPWPIMVDHGRLRPTMVDHGRPWSTMVDHGRQWSTMIDHGSTMVDP